MFTNEICPYKSHADHRDKSCDALHITHMGVLDIEAGDFIALKAVSISHRFICMSQSRSRAVEAYENLQFRTPLEFLIRLPAR